MRAKKTFVVSAISIIVLIMFSCKGDPGEAGVPGTSGENTAVMSFRYNVNPTNDYYMAKDTWIMNVEPDHNFGGCDTLRVGVEPPLVSRSLLSFDIQYITPSTVTIKSAILDIYVSVCSAVYYPTIRAYPVTKDWIEGTADCSGSTITGGAAWNYYAGAVNTWDSAGGDYDSTAISSGVTVTRTGKVSFSLDTSVVKNWLTNPSLNFGILLKADDESAGMTDPQSYVYFSSKEDSASLRPKLTVVYSIE